MRMHILCSVYVCQKPPDTFREIGIFYFGKLVLKWIKVACGSGKEIFHFFCIKTNSKNMCIFRLKFWEFNGGFAGEFRSLCIIIQLVVFGCCLFCNFRGNFRRVCCAICTRVIAIEYNNRYIFIGLIFYKCFFKLLCFHCRRLLSFLSHHAICFNK